MIQLLRLSGDFNCVAVQSVYQYISGIWTGALLRRDDPEAYIAGYFPQPAYAGTVSVASASADTDSSRIFIKSPFG
jgi:hypothetical protein